MMQHLRLLVFLSLITGLCCCIFGAIFLSDLQHAYDQLLAQRISVMASDVAATVENRVNLGLPINYLSDMQATLERSRQQSTGVESISVADEQGNVLFSTDRVAIGGVSLMPAENASSILTEQDTLRVLTPLHNSFDHMIGAVIVVGTRTHLDPIHLAQLGMPFAAAAFSVVLGLVLTFLLAWMFTQDLDTRIKVMARDAEQALALALDGQPGDDGAGETGGAPAAGPLSTRVSGMLRALNAAGNGIRHVDETA